MRRFAANRPRIMPPSAKRRIDWYCGSPPTRIRSRRCRCAPLENICYALSVLNDQVFAGKLSLLLTASGQARKSGGRFSGIDETALNALLQKGTAYYSDRYACAYLETKDTVVWYLNEKALEARQQLLRCFGVSSCCLSTPNGTLQAQES